MPKRKGQYKKPRYKLFKAFVAGFTPPALVLSILLPIVLYFNVQVQYLYIVPLAPMVWGLWNFFYIENINWYPAKHHLGVVGAFLGFILAVFSVFIIKAPQALGFTGDYIYLSLIATPIFYYATWHATVHKLNRLFGIHD